MALVNTKDRWLYLMEPHTASRAVHKLLTEKGGASNIGHHHIGMPELTNWRRQHMPPKQIEGYEIFCTIRNPFDVLVTRWRFGVGQNEPFDQWCWDNREHDVVCKPLRGLYLEATSLLYYEDLEEDLRWVFGKNTSDPIHDEFRLPFNQAHKTGGKKKWWEHYHETELGRKLFDYLKKGAYGRFCKTYGYDVDYDDDGFWCCIESDETHAIRRRVTKRLKRLRDPDE